MARAAPNGITLLKVGKGELTLVLHGIDRCQSRLLICFITLALVGRERIRSGGDVDRLALEGMVYRVGASQRELPTGVFNQEESYVIVFSSLLLTLRAELWFFM